MVEIPDAVIRAIVMPPEVLGRAGPGVVESLGVLPGVIFAVVTRASYTARTKWYQSIVCSRMSRLFGRIVPGAAARGSVR